MPKTEEYFTECTKCKSPVYYYPVKLLLETDLIKADTKDQTKRTVSCTCTGEIGGVKHTLNYVFPDNFKHSIN
jgi:hypothetical protein